MAIPYMSSPMLGGYDTSFTPYQEPPVAPGLFGSLYGANPGSYESQIEEEERKKMMLRSLLLGGLQNMGNIGQPRPIKGNIGAQMIGNLARSTASGIENYDTMMKRKVLDMQARQRLGAEEMSARAQLMKAMQQDGGKEFNINSPLEAAQAIIAGDINANINTLEGRSAVRDYIKTPKGNERLREALSSLNEYKPASGKVYTSQVTGKQYFADPNYIDPVTKQRGIAMKQVGGTKYAQDIPEEDPTRIIEGTLRRTDPVTKKQAVWYKTNMDISNEIASLYKPEYVGALIPKVLSTQKWEEFTKQYKDLPPDQVRFYRAIWNLNDNYIRPKEGAVVPEAMMVRLQKFLVDTNQTPQNFMAHFAGVVDTAKRDMANLDETTYQNMELSPFNAKDRSWYRNTQFDYNNNRLKSSTQQPSVQKQGGKREVNRWVGKKTGRTVIQYDDGSTEYAD